MLILLGIGASYMLPFALASTLNQTLFIFKNGLKNEDVFVIYYLLKKY